MSIRLLPILAGTAFALALAPCAYAQSLDFSAATGKTSGSETSTSNVTGTGQNMSGGMVDSVNAGFDISGTAVGPHGSTVTGSGGSDEATVEEMTFDVGSGHDNGSASGTGSSSGSFAGVAATVSHHH